MKLDRFHKIILATLLAAQNFLAAAQTNNAAAQTDYSTFAKFIANRNIFDPNREPGVIYVPRPPRPVVTTPPAPRVPDSFSLVGVIGYGQGSMAGTYAFFDGSSQQYRKTTQLNASIATFKVADIAADSVTLLSGTNKLILGIGEQLQDDGNGHWVFADGSTGRYNTTSGSARNSRRNSFNNGGGRRRNNNSGNGGGNGYGNNNYSGGGNNFTRSRNNYAPNPAATDNSQGQDPGGMNPDGAFIPIIIAPPDNSADQPETTPPDNNQ